MTLRIILFGTILVLLNRGIWKFDRSDTLAFIEGLSIEYKYILPGTVAVLAVLVNCDIHEIMETSKRW